MSVLLPRVFNTGFSITGQNGSTFGAISLAAPGDDPSNQYSGGNVSIKTTGTYVIFATFERNFNVNVFSGGLAFYVNGAQVAIKEQQMKGGNDNMCCWYRGTLNSGDTVSLQAYYNSGGTGQNSQNEHFSLMKVG